MYKSLLCSIALNTAAYLRCCRWSGAIAAALERKHFSAAKLLTNRHAKHLPAPDKREYNCRLMESVKGDPEDLARAMLNMKCDTRTRVVWKMYECACRRGNAPIVVLLLGEETNSPNRPYGLESTYLKRSYLAVLRW
ncbi:hypothetical protein K469DRAFT_694024 [Zopfia rhizophila CBS 207.26]|uniref:Uncharacterized protein n=1 Tax=Zopfia rhizophila CBS 207.26 TaxID=1314779 RepID=A0A6A6DMR1_9PEZI|nr:hypothetical protein K469DRAFT_694024 [Zopfia rhizophila CBS 207.26]